MGLFKPIKLLLFSFIIWLLIYLQTPVEYLYTGSAFFPIMTLFLFISSFVFGVISLKYTAIKKLNPVSINKLKQIIFFLFFLGFIGVLLKLYTGFFKTQIFLVEDVFEKRMENMNKELTGGFIGLLAALLFPFAYVVLLMVIYNYKLFNKGFLVLVILLGIYPMVETIFMGGRTIIALLGTALVFVVFASFHKNAKALFMKFKLGKTILFRIPKFILKKTVLIPLTLVGILFVTYSINVVNKRLTRFAYGNRTLNIWEQKDYQWVKFNDNFKKGYYQADEDERAKMIGIYSLKHYFAHGVIEYVRMVNHLDKTTGYYYGSYEFNVFFKFFRAFGIPLKSMQEMQEVIKRKAVYKTFWGPFYLDFGIFGIIVMFFWGRFVKRIYVHSMQGNTQYVVFYGYLSTLIITSAFINFLTGSSSYYLFAFFIGLFLFRFWPENLVFTLKK